MKTLDQLAYILQQDCRLELSRPILIGVSGGPDSICLLDIVSGLGYHVLVAHLNHGIRAEALNDARVVQEAARSRKLPFFLSEVDVRSYAQNFMLSIEEAARIVRYKFLFEQARNAQAQAVAVAHTTDDQIETVLMHLLRGAGLSGLKGMSYRFLPNPWSDQIALVRPLLGVHRQDVLTYCSEHDLHTVLDRSNFDTTYYRNRIRMELLPILETYNPNIRTQLWHMTQILAGDDQALELLVESIWNDICIEQRHDSIGLSQKKLADSPIGIQRRLVRRSIAVLRPGLRDIDFSIIERTLKYTRQPSRIGKMDLADGMQVTWEAGVLWIANTGSQLPGIDVPQIGTDTLRLSIPGCVDLQGGWQIQTKIVDDIQTAIDQSRRNTDPNRAWLDIHGEKPVFTIRTYNPGERFQPLGMNNHSIKISDFFINVKLARRYRHYWPIIYLGNRIVWVPGYRIAHPYRLTAETSRAIYVQLIKN